MQKIELKAWHKPHLLGQLDPVSSHTRTVRAPCHLAHNYANARPSWCVWGWWQKCILMMDGLDGFDK